MEKWRVELIVYNAEPCSYSETAISQWKNSGHVYEAGSWKEIRTKTMFPDVAILIVRLGAVVDRAVLLKFPNLKQLISATTGHDHIDLEALQELNVVLISLRNHDDFLKKITSTAEHTIALLLALVRNIPSANAHVKKGLWDRDAFRGTQLSGKSIGIIGLGRVGLMVANYASCFGMKVYYFDPNVLIDQFNKENSLQSLVEKVDVISVHVHLNESTEHFISNELLMHCKPGSFLINTSRGKLIHENDVIKALSVGRLAGIAVDVLSTELKSIKQSILWQYRNKYSILITPHIGGATYDAMWMCEEFVQGLALNDAS
jgi:D-3-phosphoglycerate dehydrogenase / 2-oxoglutarate reductase